MPHADSSLVPTDIKSKSAFYGHIAEQLTSLLEGSTYWVSNLAQTSSLLYHSYLSSPLYGSSPSSSSPSVSPIVNWVGFYLQHPLPVLRNTTSSESQTSKDDAGPNPLLVGPYNGRPACSFITPLPGRGVCADVFLQGRGVVVPSVEEYPGHIACDGDTQSEIVLPLRTSFGTIIGVLDLDSIRLSTFDEDDLAGLTRVVDILAKRCNWS